MPAHNPCFRPSNVTYISMLSFDEHITQGDEVERGNVQLQDGWHDAGGKESINCHSEDRARFQKQDALPVMLLLSFQAVSLNASPTPIKGTSCKRVRHAPEHPKQFRGPMQSNANSELQVCDSCCKVLHDDDSELFWGQRFCESIRCLHFDQLFQFGLKFIS